MALVRVASMRLGQYTSRLLTIMYIFFILVGLDKILVACGLNTKMAADAILTKLQANPGR